MKQIDAKHSIRVNAFGEPFIVKTSTLEPIPEDEPVILFRGRDRLALPMLNFYRKLCEEDGATDYQLESMDEMIGKFGNWAANNATKQPGITRGLKWDGKPS